MRERGVVVRRANHTCVQVGTTSLVCAGSELLLGFSPSERMSPRAYVRQSGESIAIADDPSIASLRIWSWYGVRSRLCDDRASVGVCKFASRPAILACTSHSLAHAHSYFFTLVAHQRRTKCAARMYSSRLRRGARRARQADGSC